jgi:four helix bundle protein
MRNFKKLLVWQKGMELFIEMHKFTKALPAEERYVLCSQLRRAAFSIPANIAEGSSKTTHAHYKLFLEQSLGSSFEIETGLLAVAAVYEYMSEKASVLAGQTIEIQKMLTAFIAKIEADQRAERKER